MTTVNGKSVMVIGSGVMESRVVAALLDTQMFLLTTGDPNPLAEVCEGRRFFIVEEEPPEPKPAQPFWTQGRHKKGGRRRY